MPSPTTAMRRKPHIPASCARFLAEIDDYIRRYDLRGPALLRAGADVLDGLALRSELEPLVRRRLLTIERFAEGWIEDDAMCGDDFTVAIAPRAVDCFWPDRKDPATRASVIPYWLYLLECEGGAYYAGVAIDVEARFTQHVLGRGAKFTRAFQPLRVLAARQYPSKGEALRAEIELKALHRSRKLDFFEPSECDERLERPRQRA